MVAWPTPTTVKQLRGFLGLTGYYRRFIAHYATIAAPLTELLKKDAFIWSADAEESFLQLKAAMTSAPVLSLPNFDLPFYIETDASDFGIGAVLIQNGHPLAFFSKKIGPRRRSASTYHKELYAIVEAVQKWRQYLLGREFVIRSDQKSLRELLQQIIQTPDQQFYVRKLMGYNFRIEYKTGASNRVADALSRRDPEVESDASCLTAVACPVPTLLDTLRTETARFPDLTAVREKVLAGSAPSHTSLVNGLLYYNRRIMVSSHSPSKALIMHENHSTPLAGHPGYERTFKLVAANFVWPKMRRDIKSFVAACVDCQTTKYSTQKPNGLLQPLPIPLQVWDDVSMDFITGLPNSRGFTVIMVVVDRLSKFAHFAPLPTHFDALKVAHLFIDTVVKLHGFPKTLVSDRDTIFLSAVWNDILRLSGTKLNFTTAYHPQSDGQTEVRNRGLEQYLRTFTADRPSKWSLFLPWAEIALNCSYHEGFGTSPYRALYGREPPSLLSAPLTNDTTPTAAELLTERDAVLADLRENLRRAQQRMRDNAKKHRRDINLDVGDRVLLRLQPYRQHSVARPLSAKLARRYYGPFTVVERIGPVAYRLDLPEVCRIHNVFHVSLLRPFVEGQSAPPSPALPTTLVDGCPVTQPIALVGRRTILQRGVPVEQGKVRWTHGDTTSESWEPITIIQSRFPSLLEDKELLIGEGVDTVQQPKSPQTRPNEPQPKAQTKQPNNKKATIVAAQEPSERPRRITRPPDRFKDFSRR